MDIKALVLIGIVGFLGSTIKSSPKLIINSISYIFGYNIVVNSGNKKAYDSVNNYIFKNIKSKIIKRKAKLDRRYVDCKEVLTMSLGLGNFIIFENRCIYIISHKKEEKKHFEEYQIEIIIIGMNAKKIHSDIIKHSMSKNENGKIGVRLGHTYKHVNGRSLDTIYCGKNAKQNIITEINNFNSRRNIYKENGIPYRIGFLLYGEPGTGKTSMAKAIATYTNRDINIINLDDLKNLPDLLDRVSENEILLIEEIDTVVGSREDNSKENREFGNLLNLLDGVGTPENLIIIATTNHISKLDDALIRDGRFDVKEELKYLTIEEAKTILRSKSLSLKCLDKKDINFPVAPSRLQLEILKQLKID